MKNTTVAVATIATTAAAAVLLLRFPPTQYPFYPRCPIYAYLHLECPGCGATRALAALLHGHLAEALHENALFVALLPLVAAYATLCLYRACTAPTFHWPALPRWTTPTALTLTAAFTFLRNLPH